MTRNQPGQQIKRDMEHAFSWVAQEPNGVLIHSFPSRTYEAKIFCDPVDDGLGANQAMQTTLSLAEAR